MSVIGGDNPRFSVAVRTSRGEHPTLAPRPRYKYLTGTRNVILKVQTGNSFLPPVVSSTTKAKPCFHPKLFVLQWTVKVTETVSLTDSKETINITEKSHGAHRR